MCADKELKIPLWKKNEYFPKSDGSWMVLDGKVKKTVSKRDATTNAKKWNYLNTILYATPSTSQFLPPILVPELSNFAYASVLGNMKKMALITFIVSAAYFFLFSGLVFRQVTNIAIVFVMTLSFLYFYAEYRYSLKNKDIVIERSLYLNWIRRNNGFNYYALLATICFFGLMQLIFQVFGSSEYYLIKKIGVIYTSIDEKEYWRFFIGPFLHSGLSHWIVNTTNIIIFFPLLNAFRSKIHLVLVYASIVASAIMAYTFRDAATSEVEGFVGVSASVYYVLGFMLSNMAFNKRWYPKNIGFSLVFITIFMLTLPYTYSNKINVISHITGLLLGLIAGAFFSPPVTVKNNN